MRILRVPFENLKTEVLTLSNSDMAEVKRAAGERGLSVEELCQEMFSAQISRERKKENLKRPVEVDLHV